MRHKVVLYPNIHFQGYHPDLVYITVASTGGHFAGPGGHYNSSIALLAWKAGLSVADALELYRGDVYRRLGFFDYWESACAELRNDFQAAGLPLDSFLDAWTKRGCFMHSINHPKLFVSSDLVARLLKEHGIETLPGDPMRYVRDYLADSVVWPVYPEIGERLGIPGSYLFKLSAPGIQPDSPVRSLGLEEFVALSYSAFSSHAPDELVCARLDLPCYRQLLEESQQRCAVRGLAAPDVPASRDSITVPAGQRDEASFDAADLARLEEARTLFKPESVFWSHQA
jgi:hypothetical protein